MLTKIILEGPMGKKFGRTWNLNVKSPSEALRIINANKPGVFNWIRSNIEKYSRYKVIVEHESGNVEHLENDTYVFNCKAKSIRFVPIIEGAGGGVGQAVLGSVLFVVGAVAQFGYGQPWGTSLMLMGAAMMIGGVAQMLSPKPNVNSSTSDSSSNISSYYFDGPVNTTAQGVPVQLIYGRCLVGSHAISVKATIDQLM